MDAMIPSVGSSTRAQIDAAIRETASDYLDELTALRHAQLSRHDPVADYNRWTEVSILDRLGNAASLKMGGATGLGAQSWSGEYQHHVLWNGRWSIIHVLWGLLPGGPHDIDEEPAITRTAVEYIESFYKSDGAQLEHCLHPHVVRRTVIPSGALSSHLVAGDYLNHMSGEALIQFVASGGGCGPEVDRRVEVTILDRVSNAASVRVDASSWIEYLHLCKWNGRWAIINSLWSKRAAAQVWRNNV